MQQLLDVEDPPPFTDHGWSLWRMREDIEDWHESLRILYVACTRARDYLILSARDVLAVVS